MHPGRRSSFPMYPASFDNDLGRLGLRLVRRQRKAEPRGEKRTSRSLLGLILGYTGIPARQHATVMQQPCFLGVYRNVRVIEPCQDSSSRSIRRPPSTFACNLNFWLVFCLLPFPQLGIRIAKLANRRRRRRYYTCFVQLHIILRRTVYSALLTESRTALRCIYLPGLQSVFVSFFLKASGFGAQGP